ncbi:MAG: LysM peptidoglycan-binding domain-containing protein [Microbacterium sp.]|uniref:LysM peptidoglycan-binding domain-containing protein n=1 Tax=Microbacterium sp. TaxID=51671 RepID=UPI0039E3A424
MRHREPRRPGRGCGLPIAIAGSLIVTLGLPTSAAAESVAHSAAPAIHPGSSFARPATTVAASRAATAHVVKPGDTVSGIAERHGVSTRAVLSANGLSWSSIIYPGQKLRIPGSDAAPAARAAQPTAKATALHTVRAGDTVYAIAAQHGLSTEAVLSANALTASSIIYPGQKLRIPAASSAASTKSTASASGIVALDAEQRRNAKLIIRVGRQLGVPNRGIAIALGAAMQESSLRNLDGGDRDSLGLFQQRPSQGWGSSAQVRDAERSTRVFYGGPNNPNAGRTRGLLDIPGWKDMSFAQAAQAVQISAYPDRYARWEDDAHAWLRAHG